MPVVNLETRGDDFLSFYVSPMFWDVFNANNDYPGILFFKLDIDMKI